MSVVVVQPDAVDLKGLQHPAKLLHALTTVARVVGAHALPAIGCRARLSIRADGCGVRMLAQEGRVMHGVELRKNLQPHGAMLRDLRRLQSA
jgi:hypothetical protein